MKSINSKKKFCLTCMNEHEVPIVEIEETTEFKNKQVTFNAAYEWCSNLDILSESEEQIRANDIKMKDAYREMVGLLTSKEIINLRQILGVSQKDFSNILDWGGATIARYETHQVQDKVHDDMLRKLSNDPNWYLELLEAAKGKLAPKAYNKYYRTGLSLLSKSKDAYLRIAIKAEYARYQLREGGNQLLDLDKVIEMINYFASKISPLHRVKLLKCLWYSDALSFNRRNQSISGLVYQSLPLGAVPVSHEQILQLEGIIQASETDDKGRPAYRIVPNYEARVQALSDDELSILDRVIEEFGEMRSRTIIDRMHKEEAYSIVKESEVIPYDASLRLSIK